VDIRLLFDFGYSIFSIIRHSFGHFLLIVIGRYSRYRGNI
jgi:hypothetical protein